MPEPISPQPTTPTVLISMPGASVKRRLVDAVPAQPRDARRVAGAGRDAPHVHDAAPPPRSDWLGLCGRRGGGGLAAARGGLSYRCERAALLRLAAAAPGALHFGARLPPP